MKNSRLELARISYTFVYLLGIYSTYYDPARSTPQLAVQNSSEMAIAMTRTSDRQPMPLKELIPE